MSFSNGFASGASVGNQIQQRLLAKELRKLENTRYEDEKTYRRGRDATMDARYTDETGYSRGRDRTMDTRYGDEQAYRRRRDSIGDRRADNEAALRMGNAGMQQIAEARRAQRDSELTRARMGEIKARTQAIQAGRYSPMSGGYEEYDGEGNLLKRRAPLGVGAPQAAEGALSPEAQQIANRIAELQTGIGEHKVNMAQGDNRTGFLNLFSRQGKIDDATAEIARLQQMQGGQGGAPRPAAQPSQPAAQLTPQDQQALQWAQANQNDPRAAAILQRFAGQ